VNQGGNHQSSFRRLRHELAVADGVKCTSRRPDYPSRELIRALRPGGLQQMGPAGEALRQSADLCQTGGNPRAAILHATKTHPWACHAQTLRRPPPPNARRNTGTGCCGPSMIRYNQALQMEQPFRRLEPVRPSNRRRLSIISRSRFQAAGTGFSKTAAPANRGSNARRAR